MDVTDTMRNSIPMHTFIDDFDPNHRQLTLLERNQRIQMEKTGTWWSKYYASKAKLVSYHSYCSNYKNIMIMFFIETGKKTKV